MAGCELFKSFPNIWGKATIKNSAGIQNDISSQAKEFQIKVVLSRFFSSKSTQGCGCHFFVSRRERNLSNESSKTKKIDLFSFSQKSGPRLLDVFFSNRGNCRNTFHCSVIQNILSLNMNSLLIFNF